MPLSPRSYGNVRAAHALLCLLQLIFTASGQPDMCGDTLFYNSTSGACQRGPISNCKRYASSSKCTECNIYYYANAEGSRCLQPISGCEIYRNFSFCEICDSKKFLENGFCRSSFPISCELPINQTHCRLCKSAGYVLDGSQCQSLTAGRIPKCLYHIRSESRELQCLQCEPSYYP